VKENARNSGHKYRQRTDREGCGGEALSGQSPNVLSRALPRSEFFGNYLSNI
jgi:hypothetical protein